MGTSSIYGGKKDKSSLLPSDYNAENNVDNSVTWKALKTETSRFVSSGGNYGSAKHIVSNYVKASGGASALTNRSSSGIRTAGNIGNFFYGVKQNGVANTLRQVGIEFQGRSVYEVFSRLVDVFVESADTKEDGAARKATQAALVDVYSFVEQNDMDINCVAPLSA